MLKAHSYRVAGFPLEVFLPAGPDVDRLLPSFAPFRCESPSEAAGDRLFRLTACCAPLPIPTDCILLGESDNDMGRVRLWEHAEGYRVEVEYEPAGAVAVMHADGAFRSVRACLPWAHPLAGVMLSSLLRIAYSLAVPFRGAVSLHAAAVTWRGRAFLFMGKSGTGKSTHAGLWLRCLDGCTLLNDDNPTVRVEDAHILAYGTPWSGKTPCYRNLGVPLGGIVRLRPARANRFVPRTEAEAFATLLPGCSVVHTLRPMCAALYDTLTCLATSVPTGELECLPDESAARLCAASLTGTDSI